ncbi:MAG TPA: YkgJ family cysteine cluster protein [Verrucomicrobiota bacterium]|nr:YkgJ family cysteine cluster protein [Verrucomicrobiota bacterium]
MNRSSKADDQSMNELCTACGLCCSGVLFADVRLRSGDDASRLRSLGLAFCASQSSARLSRVPQPCAALEGTRCRVYGERPRYCREFECVLLKSAKEGRTGFAAALRVIRTARERAEKVSRLLSALGDTEDDLRLSARFRRTSNRLQQQDLDEETADTYAQLTLAVHDLNLLLGDAFYPGSASPKRRTGTRRIAVAAVWAVIALLSANGSLQADQVDLRNGDRYVGQILSLDTNAVVLQSDVLGMLRLPRSTVAGITLGPTLATNCPVIRPASPAVSTNAAASLPPLARGLASSSNLIQQVQKQFLGEAGPEVNDKYRELLGGLMSGKLSVGDIRAQAKSAADQLREFKREGGDQMGFATEAYLAILDHFVRETAPLSTATNAPATSSVSNSAPVQRGK